jgi:hypothetical protein
MALYQTDKRQHTIFHVLHASSTYLLTVRQLHLLQLLQTIRQLLLCTTHAAAGCI